METTQKSLPLILARELAANVAVPVFLVDAQNTLVFYNEAAEPAFGGPFGKTSLLRTGDWGRRYAPRRLDGSPCPRPELPVVVALEQHRPAHGEHLVTAPDGTEVAIAVTAVPLFTQPETFTGVMCLFWPLGRG